MKKEQKYIAVIYPFDDKYIWFLNKEDIDALITFLDKF